MRPPGKGSPTFDHILTRLQGELQKSRETGAELHSLNGLTNEIHDAQHSLVSHFTISISSQLTNIPSSQPMFLRTPETSLQLCHFHPLPSHQRSPPHLPHSESSSHKIPREPSPVIQTRSTPSNRKSPNKHHNEEVSSGADNTHSVATTSPGGLICEGRGHSIKEPLICIEIISYDKFKKSDKL